MFSCVVGISLPVCQHACLVGKYRCIETAHINKVECEMNGNPDENVAASFLYPSNSSSDPGHLTGFLVITEAGGPI